MKPICTRTRLHSALVNTDGRSVLPRCRFGRSTLLNVRARSAGPQVVVSRSKRAVPYPILGENTLVLSESAVLTEEDGELALMFRCPTRSPAPPPLPRAPGMPPTIEPPSACCFLASEASQALDSCLQSRLLRLRSVLCNQQPTCMPPVLPPVTVTAKSGWRCPQHLLVLSPCRQQSPSPSAPVRSSQPGCASGRVGDTYPNQILDPIVRVYLYRWPDKPSSKERDYTVGQFSCNSGVLGSSCCWFPQWLASPDVVAIVSAATS